MVYDDGARGCDICESTVEGTHEPVLGPLLDCTVFDSFYRNVNQMEMCEHCAFNPPAGVDIDVLGKLYCGRDGSVNEYIPNLAGF